MILVLTGVAATTTSPVSETLDMLVLLEEAIEREERIV